MYGRISVWATETRFPQADVLSDPSSHVAGAPCDGAWGDLGRRRLERINQNRGKLHRGKLA